jgi:Tol biopolymer transport system component
MPDVQEVFRMATEKVRQEPGALDRQVTKQHKAAKNRRIGAFAAVLVLVAAAIGVYAFSRGATQEVPANHGSTATSIPVATGGSMVDLDTGRVTALPTSIFTWAAYYAVSPDHTKVVYSTCCQHPAPLYVANIDGTGVRRISARGQDAFGAQWSPDGTMVVYQQRDASTSRLGNLVVQKVATGERTLITNFDQTRGWGWWFTYPSFAPDGRSILFQLPRGESNTSWDLWSVPVTGGKPTLVLRNAGWGAYSPDGTKLAYLSPINEATFTGQKLWITNVLGGTPRAMVTNGDIRWLRWSPDGTRVSYADRAGLHVLDVATGSATTISEGVVTAEWLDDHTLVIGSG